jgi:hypothetical protein
MVYPAAGTLESSARRTSQTVAAMRGTDSMSSRPPSMNWSGQNRSEQSDDPVLV